MVTLKNKDMKLKARSIYEKYGVVLVFIFEIILCSILSERFFAWGNILNILRQIAMTGILAVGMTFVCITGGIDLSVGAIIAMVTVFTADTIKSTGSIPLAILVGIAAGLAIGLLNGAGIAFGKMPPFVMTLGTTSVARGIAYIYTNGMPISIKNRDFTAIGNRMLFGKIPVAAIYFLVVLLVGFVLLSKTVFGRHVYSVGSNAEATRLSGISVKRTLFLVYAMSGLLAGVAGVLYAAQMGIGTPIAGDGYELSAISAVFVGGASVSGGSGTIWGTFFGAAIIGILNNIMNLTGVNTYFQMLISGLIIIVAVLVRRKR